MKFIFFFTLLEKINSIRKMKNSTTNRVIDYALCYLNSNWDEWIEEDLGISHENFVKIIEKFQKENFPFDISNKNI